jgi:hypothetical protein
MGVIHQLPRGLWDVRDDLKGTKLDNVGFQIPGTLAVPDQKIKTAEIVFSPGSALGGVDTYRIHRMMAARVTTAR